MWPTWCVATTLYQEKFDSFDENLSTTAGRYIVVPSVVGKSPSTQPMFFSTICDVGDSSMLSPTSALQYVLSRSRMRDNSTPDARVSSTSCDRADSSRK